ncbi:MAG TPA: winged helix-turn-helix domain-containing protein [Blastocatellia bacterium]|nr:winged helix-turn-helix domain-containing protein [Blastocatellia bacterium]
MTKDCYEFGPFCFDARKQTLTRDGEPIRLKAKACDLLKVLLEHHGEALDKERLMTLLWPDTVVEENNLTVHMTALRKALGERPNDNRYIVTIPGRGYRFVAEVQSPAAMPLATEADAEAVTPAKDELTRIPRTKPRRLIRFGALAMGVVALVGGVIYWLKPRPQPVEPTPALPTIKSLAVLPFRSLTPKPGEDYIGVGIADVMITRLSNLSQLVVRPTSSVLAFSGQDAVEAGQLLKVDLVLDGSIQRQGDRMRVTVRLLRVSDGQALMAMQCDEKCADLFALQDAISNQVTEALALQLTGDERQRLMKNYTGNAAAYQEYLKGRFHTLQYTPDGFKNAIVHLNNAIRLDPTYALAYAGLADAYTAASDWLLPPREALGKARAAAQKALALDDTLAEAHAALGHVKLHRSEPDAESELQRALQLNPNSVAAMLWYGEYFMAKDLTKGLAILHQAQRLDPLSPVIGSFITASYALARQPDGALTEARKTVALDPNDAFARGLLAEAYDAEGDYAAAISEAEKLRQLVINPQQLGTLGRDYVLVGKPDEARRVLAEMDRLAQRQYVSPYDRAIIYATLGDKDQAFAWLNKAYDDQSEWIGWLQADYRLDSLHGDPRFDDLVRRVGLSS